MFCRVVRDFYGHAKLREFSGYSVQSRIKFFNKQNSFSSFKYVLGFTEISCISLLYVLYAFQTVTLWIT